MSPALFAALGRNRTGVVAPSGLTISDSGTTSVTRVVISSADITLTVTASTVDAAGIVYAGAGTSNPIGSISGSIGAVSVISVPDLITSIHVDWAGASAGSLTFTIAQ